MKTKKEIKARQERFVNAYRFSKNDTTPKMKACTSAINASVRTRGYKVYSDRVEGRSDAVNYWKAQLEQIGKKYESGTPDRNVFIKDVFDLQDTINNSEYKDYFVGGIRVGQCQKSLSIYLKWMWCQGQLAGIPPVCPIDGQILRKCRQVLKKHNDYTPLELRDTYIAWSNLNDRCLYERLVTITEKVTRKESELYPCVWELFAFDEPE